jgi:hypothetical protein
MHLSIDTIFLFNDFFTATRGREKNVLIISSFIYQSSNQSESSIIEFLVVVCVDELFFLFFLFVVLRPCVPYQVLIILIPYGKEQHNNTTGQGRRGGLDRTKENMKKRG